MYCAIHALSKLIPDADFDQFRPIAQAKNGLSISDAAIIVAQVTDAARLEIIQAGGEPSDYKFNLGQTERVLFYVACKLRNEGHAVCVRSDGGNRIDVYDMGAKSKMTLTEFQQIYKPTACAVLATNDSQRVVISSMYA